MITVEEQGKPTVASEALDHPVEVDRPVSITVDAKSAKSGLKIDVRGQIFCIKIIFSSNQCNCLNDLLFYGCLDIHNYGQYLIDRLY